MDNIEYSDKYAEFEKRLELVDAILSMTFIMSDRAIGWLIDKMPRLFDEYTKKEWRKFANKDGIMDLSSLRGLCLENILIESVSCVESYFEYFFREFLEVKDELKEVHQEKKDEAKKILLTKDPKCFLSGSFEKGHGMNFPTMINAAKELIDQTHHSDFEKLVRAQVIRNLILHHKGRLNKRFLQQLNLESAKIGDQFDTKIQDALDALFAAKGAMRSMESLTNKVQRQHLQRALIQLRNDL